MSDAEWRHLCQATLLELDPKKLLERIAFARSVVLDRIEDHHSKPVGGEQADLRQALSTLDSLRRITERHNGYPSKSG
jgi:hypothetical protein